MNSLVAYGSSDEEDEVQTEKPAKIAKLAQRTAPQKTESQPAKITALKQRPDETPAVATNQVTDNERPQPALGPPTVPTAPPAPISPGETTVGVSENYDPASLSPYTYERQRLRELTMPTVPNFDIPDSPPPPPTNSEEAAVLAHTTKKFERFLELKKQGVHFNERLRDSSSLRNPSLLPKLRAFAGITEGDSHASSLPEGLGVPMKWPEECYAENLVKQNERREKRRLAQRDRVEFVPASKRQGSADGGEHRKSRAEKR